MAAVIYRELPTVTQQTATINGNVNATCASIWKRMVMSPGGMEEFWDKGAGQQDGG